MNGDREIQVQQTNKQKAKEVLSINKVREICQKKKYNETDLIRYAMLCYAKSPQSCPTLCNPIDSSPPGSPVPGILQARTLEWVAISFSNA